MTMNAMQWMVMQVSKDTAPCERPSHFNPRPAGVIVAGSSSERVLAYLRRDFRLKTRAEIIRALADLSEHRVEWALIYLQRRCLIEWCADPSRNARYGRYRALYQDGISQCEDEHQGQHGQHGEHGDSKRNEGGSEIN